MKSPLILTGLGLCALLSATACGRVSEVGRTPKMTEPHATPEFQAMAEPVMPLSMSSTTTASW